MTTTRAEIIAALDLLTSTITRKDMAIMDQFDDAPEVVFAGSEMYQVNLGRAAIEQFFRMSFGLPLALAWEWEHLHTGAEGDVAWLFAQGYFIMDVMGEIERNPYRLSGILVRRDGQLLWRQFNGSRPKP